MRVAIAGAGNVGRAIARELLDNGHQVLLIDKDPKALKLESVPDAEWLMADACEITSLDNAHLNTCQVLVAATGDDKANLVTSLLGKNFEWRKNPERKKVYTRASWIWVAMFFSRIAVQYPIYRSGNVNLLGTVNLAMGYPLFFATAYGSWLVIKTAPPVIKSN